MKLHLPKQLFTALLAAITLAAPSAWGELYVKTAADFYGGNHAFVFTLDSTLLTSGDADLLAAYWGTAITNTYGANAYEVSYNGSEYTFTAGRGHLSSGTLDDNANIAYQENLTCNTLKAGHRYLVQVKGESQKQTITLVDLDYDVDNDVDNDGSIIMSGSSYNGNMNGNTETMNTAVSSQSGYGVSAVYVWNATTGSESAEFTTSNFWATPDSITDKNVFFAKDLTDTTDTGTTDTVTTYTKKVNVTSATSVANMDVYDDYTFGGNGSLTVTGDLNIGAGASATFDVATTLSGGTITNNGSLTLNGALSSGNLDIRGKGSFIFNTNLTLNDNTLTATATSITVNGAMYVKGGTVNLGNGKDSGMITLTRVEIGDKNGGQSTFNVESGYTLKVTGSENTIQSNTTQYKTNSFVVSEWNNSTTMTVEGTILAENAAVMTGDSGVTINIENGGTLATKGLGRSNPGKTAVSTVNLKAGGTLVLGDMGMDYDGKVTANISGGKIGIAAESVTIADALNITGNLSVDTTQYSYGESGLTQGTTGGKLVFGSDLTGGGTLTASGEGSLEFGAISSGVSISTGTAGVNFAGTLAMGDATTFTVGSGSFSVDASNLNNFSVQPSTSFVDEVGNTAINGFAAGARTVIDGGTINGAFTLTYDGETYTIDNENRTFGPADYIDLGTWYINSGTSTLSEIYAKSSTAAISAAGDTTLNVDTTLSTGLELTGNATMNISQGTTLAASAITTNGNKVTLNGSGTYSITRGNATNVAVAEGWTGTVELFGQGSSSSHATLDLTSYGRSGSTISIKEYVGYFSNDKNSTKNIDANLVLTNTNLAAVEIKNGYTGGVYNFNGSISGDGNFIVNKDLGDAKSMSFNFKGDISGWTGNMDVTSGEHNVTYTGVSTINNLTIQARDGNSAKMNLSIENASAAVEVNSTITNNDNNTVNLTTNAAQGVLFNNNVNVTQLTVANGSSAMINADGKTITAGKVQISQRNATLSNVTVQDSSISATADGTKGSISNAQLTQLQADATFTIEDMTLTNTTITAATTTTQVKLQNVTASNVVLAQGKFSTDADMGVTVGMGGSGSYLAFEGGLASDTITINASEGASLAVDLGDLSCVTKMGPGKYDLSITLSGVKLDSYTDLEVGAGITFAGWLGELISASSGVQVSFSEAVAEEPPAAAAEGGAATGVTYSTDSVDTVITITGLNVPEPASATLGLAALMMLCARRRRKA